mgnify:CR=1 FL=1
MWSIGRAIDGAGGSAPLESNPEVSDEWRESIRENTDYDIEEEDPLAPLGRTTSLALVQLINTMKAEESPEVLSMTEGIARIAGQVRAAKSKPPPTSRIPFGTAIGSMVRSLKSDSVGEPNWPQSTLLSGVDAIRTEALHIRNTSHEESLAERESMILEERQTLQNELEKNIAELEGEIKSTKTFFSKLNKELSASISRQLLN